MNTSFRGGILSLFGALAIACTTTTTTSPSSSPPPAGPSTEEDAGDSTPVETVAKADVQKLFSDRKHGCTSCHDKTDEHGLGMDLTDFAKDTVGVPPASSGGDSACGESSYKLRIAPGDREASLLWHKVKGSHDCGRAMPSNGGTRFSATELDLLGRWIDALPTE
jgi:hypothetical protein